MCVCVYVCMSVCLSVCVLGVCVCVCVCVCSFLYLIPFQVLCLSSFTVIRHVKECLRCYVSYRIQCYILPCKYQLYLPARRTLCCILPRTVCYITACPVLCPYITPQKHIITLCLADHYTAQCTRHKAHYTTSTATRDSVIQDKLMISIYEAIRLRSERVQR